MVFLSTGADHHELALPAHCSISLRGRFAVDDILPRFYLLDEDGIELELYVDEDPEVWRRDPSAVATVRPFSLD